MQAHKILHFIVNVNMPGKVWVSLSGFQYLLEVDTYDTVSYITAVYCTIMLVGTLWYGAFWQSENDCKRFFNRQHILTEHVLPIYYIVSACAYYLLFACLFASYGSHFQTVLACWNLFISVLLMSVAVSNYV